MMKEPVLTVDVILDDIIEVNGSTGVAAMILFHGNCSCKNFEGKILPGGVDTQKQEHGKERLLSARYVLEGTDLEGQKCRIFIENNGAITEPGPGAVIKTTPKIYTDSKALKLLETAKLSGTVEGKEGGVFISIYD